MKGLEYKEPGQSWWQKAVSVIPGVDLRDQYGSVEERDLTAAERAEIDKQWAPRSAYEAPPLGQANLAQYGQGQLSNYGMGGMVAYQPLMREEYLRWR